MTNIVKVTAIILIIFVCIVTVTTHMCSLYIYLQGSDVYHLQGSDVYHIK